MVKCRDLSKRATCRQPFGNQPDDPPVADPKANRATLAVRDRSSRTLEIASAKPTDAIN
jgi:hypothetical protein